MQKQGYCPNVTVNTKSASFLQAPSSALSGLAVQRGGGSRDTYSRNPSVIHGTGSPLTGAGVCFSHGSQSRFRCRHSYMSLHLFSRCVSVVLARAQSICFGEELRRDIVSVVLARAQSICFGEELRCDIIPMAFKRRAC